MKQVIREERRSRGAFGAKMQWSSARFDQTSMENTPTDALKSARLNGRSWKCLLKMDYTFESKLQYAQNMIQV